MPGTYPSADPLLPGIGTLPDTTLYPAEDGHTFPSLDTFPSLTSFTDTPTVVETFPPFPGVGESYTLALLIEVLDPNERVIYELDTVLDGSVTLDSTAASRGRLELTLAVDDDALVPTSSSSLLAPFGNEIRVSRGVRIDDRTQLSQLGIFGIDRCSVQDSGEDIQISLSGLDRSWHFIDSPFELPHSFASGLTVNALLLDVLTAADAWAASHLVTAFAATTPLLPALFVEEGESRWDFAQGLATAIGGELYFNDQGVLVLEPTARAGPVAATFAEGEGGLLLGINRDWDRANVYNRVIVTGETTSDTEDAVPPRGVATDDDPASPTYYGGPFGKKPYWYANDKITTDAQARTAAEAMLARALGAPDNIGFGSVVDPARRPGDLVRITRERLGVNENHLIDGLTIPLTVEGEMSGRTRVAQELFSG